MALKTTPARHPSTRTSVRGQPWLTDPKTDAPAAKAPAKPLERVTPQKIAGIVGELAHPAAHVGQRPVPRVVKAGGVAEKSFVEGIKVRELLNAAQSPEVSITIATVAPGMRTALHVLDVDEHQL